MSKSKTLAPAAIAQLLKKAQKQGFLADILAEVELASAQEKKGNNIEVRKAAILKALSTKNELALAEITEALAAHDKAEFAAVVEQIADSIRAEAGGRVRRGCIQECRYS